jgi:formylglycine-generating enzyme required for sulfatase activity
MMKLLPEGYCIDTTEVTREQYQAWLVTNPQANVASQIPECAWNGTFVPGSDATYDWPPKGNFNTPINYVDWCDAYSYCKGVGKRLCGKIGGGALLSSDDLTSSNFSQWTNACSAHGTNDYAYGDTPDSGYCNGGDGASPSGIEAVAFRPKCQSPTIGYEGIYDLSGNVQEFEDNCDLGVGMSANCITRGGAYHFWDTQMWCTSTYSVLRSSASVGLGFRCCTK